METSSSRRGWLAARRTAAFMGAPLWSGLKGLTQIGTSDTDPDTGDGMLRVIDREADVFDGRARVEFVRIWRRCDAEAFFRSGDGRADDRGPCTGERKGQDASLVYPGGPYGGGDRCPWNGDGS